MKFKDMIPFLEENKKDIKVHCAIGRKNVFEPLEQFKLGKFKEWQEIQTKKNFGRKFILSLIFNGKDEWLFAGIYESLGVKEPTKDKWYKYDTRLIDFGNEYIGKAVIRFKKEFRASYLCLERYLDYFELLVLYRDVVKPTFPGYDEVNVSWKELSEWIETDSWKTALENQKGVYLITDVNTGKRYVGSAKGEDMILGRWRSYVKNGHGGNVELKCLDFDYIKENFRYSLLEIFKSTIDDNIISKREDWWKKVLLTRNKRFGYNDN
ncbi:MAG TPA: hypothetical protein DDX72_04010 [Ruminococcaceae bacterium]|nr:hypothetical protein [Oscillospiraceae bacterium]